MASILGESRSRRHVHQAGGKFSGRKWRQATGGSRTDPGLGHDQAGDRGGGQETPKPAADIEARADQQGGSRLGIGKREVGGLGWIQSGGATAEVFKYLGANAGELMLYNGSSLVADLHISGQNHVYASYTPGTPFGGSITISAHDNGNSLPIVRHVT